jgi:hypothetical protein
MFSPPKRVERLKMLERGEQAHPLYCSLAQLQESITFRVDR